MVDAPRTAPRLARCADLPSLLAVIVGALYAIVPPIVGEVASFVTTIPDLITHLQTNPTIKNLDVKFHLLSALQSSSFVQTIGSGAAGSILSVGVTVAGIAADALVVLVLTCSSSPDTRR